MKNIKILLLFAVTLLSLTACGAKPAEETDTVTPPVTDNTAPVTAPVADEVVNEGEAVVFNLIGQNFRFIMNGTESPDLRVKKGDRVLVRLMGGDMLHDWVLDEFNAATKQIKVGEEATVEFVADKTGTFEYYCSVGQHRAKGMKGNFIVE